ncbi:carboxypeptidase B-like [Patiria miniata]|uniref:Peptidase M14 domain-containing protein n=1 Tax=Patiria miniata TaxID=46514 RepID=A0A914A479_PATMI|nr:carboxypeptidase B-like [Patiria miniata]
MQKVQTGCEVYSEKLSGGIPGNIGLVLVPNVVWGTLSSSSHYCQLGYHKLAIGADSGGNGVAGSMMLKLAILFIIVGFVAKLNCDPARYDGYKLLRVHTRHRRDLEAVKRIHDAADERLDFWREPRSVHGDVDIMVSAEHQDYLSDLLQDGGLEAKTIIEDIQEAFEEQSAINTEEEKEFFGSYQNLSQINEWMFTLGADYPDIVTVYEIATSYEGRPIHCLKVSDPYQAAESTKPAIFIMGGIHSREWLSPATVMFITNELVENYGIDSEIKELLEGLDWYIVPVFNVDGYVFSWEKYRFWRKTRSEYDHNRCKGADPNRNWDFEWGVSGVSDMSCDDTYAGPFAFSETEVRQIADYLTDLNARQPINGFIDFHAYSQLWMTPYGYDTVLPDNYQEQYNLAKDATDALRKVNGTDYTVGNIADVIYKASGNSVDWARGKLRVPYTYAVELPDKGRYGFLMPPRYIIPTGEETMEAIRVIGQGVMAYKGSASKLDAGLPTA